jgi:hypothetical protein
VKYFVGVVIAVAILATVSQPVFADSALQLQPLQYEESIKPAERKKGFIDITNPSFQDSRVKFSVEGFRQIDDKGNLAFYPSDQLRAAIQLDYDEYVIPAQKTLRLYFIIDGAKLPTGDAFAAIFAQALPEAAGSASSSVRIGTLLILTNGTPSEHSAEVTKLQMPWLQLGESLTGVITVKNTASKTASSGFFPHIELTVWPFGKTETVRGPLIFAGNARAIKINQSSSQFGLYKVTARYGSSQQEQWVVLITGAWRWITSSVAVLIVLVATVYGVLRRRHAHRR